MNLKTNIQTPCPLLLVFAVVITMLVSCSPKLTQPVAMPTIDSVIVTNIVHDTSFVIRPDSSLLRALLDADSLGNVHIKMIEDMQAGKNLRVPHIAIKNNVLTVTAQVDSFSVAVKWNERHVQEVKNKPVMHTVIKTVNHVNTVQKTLMWIGCVFMLLIILGIILKIKKIL